jgi:hypothetical protein
MEEDTPRPSIDLDSPQAASRHKEFMKRFPKYDKKDYAKTYSILKKFRNRQQMLLNTEDIEDPDPFEPTYIFYCFTGKLED